MNKSPRRGRRASRTGSRSGPRRARLRQQSGWLGFGLARFATLLRPLLNARCAGAGLAQPCKAPRALVPVGPVDLYPLALGQQYAHLLRRDGNVGKRAILRISARLFVFSREANAFVTHISSLQGRRDYDHFVHSLHFIQCREESEKSEVSKVSERSLFYSFHFFTFLHCLAKNHAAIPSPIATTNPRRTGCGTRRARLAEE